MVLLPLVWPLPLSLATTKGISVDVFSSPYLDVSVQAVPPVYLWIQYTVAGLLPAGFPHSGTHGSRPAFGSPWLFADCCALHRLPVPRHPPCALLSLTRNSFPLLCSVKQFPEERLRLSSPLFHFASQRSLSVLPAIDQSCSNHFSGSAKL